MAGHSRFYYWYDSQGLVIRFCISPKDKSCENDYADCKPVRHDPLGAIQTEREDWIKQNRQHGENPQPEYALYLQGFDRRISKHRTANPAQQWVKTVRLFLSRGENEHDRYN